MKARLVFFAQDDASTEQGQIFGRFTQALDRLVNNITKLVQTEVEKPEYKVGANSPYAFLTEEQKFNIYAINKVRDGILPFMYFSEDLAQFEKEYNEIIVPAIKTFKEKRKIVLQRLLTELNTIPGDLRKKQNNDQLTVSKVTDPNNKQQRAQVARQNKIVEMLDQIKKQLTVLLDQMYQILGIEAFKTLQEELKNAKRIDDVTAIINLAVEELSK